MDTLGLLGQALECSICLDQLDMSSRVLPCQHTFCANCLLDIINSHKELRCPECRALVTVPFEALKPNIILMRILEGMKNFPQAAAHKKDTFSNFNSSQSLEEVTKTPINNINVAASVSANNKAAVTEQGNVFSEFTNHLHAANAFDSGLINVSSHRNIGTPLFAVNECVAPLNLQAKALFSYDKQEDRDLSFKKGSVIRICKQIDENWYFGELNEQSGFIPSSYVEIVEPLPSHVPQCRALYDFKINVQEEKNCLTFNKGDTITVLRRIDDNWAEGKMNTRTGIFPLSFVRLNDAAKTLLLKMFNNSISQGLPSSSNSPSLPNLSCKKDTNSIVTTSPPVAVNLTSCTSVLSPLVSPTSLHSDQVISRVEIGIDVKLDDQKKYSSIDFQPGSHSSSESSLRSNRLLDATNASENSKNIIKSNGNQEINPEPSTQLSEYSEKLASHQLYVALYSYRPRKADELELRKGYLYSVSNKCLDGWCKGRCLSTDKIGVFPGNYIQLAKASTISAFLSRCSPNVLQSSPSRNTIIGSISPFSSLTREFTTNNTTNISNPRPLSAVASTSSSQADFYHQSNMPSIPPELPPRHINNFSTSTSVNTTVIPKNLSKDVRSLSSAPPCPSPMPPQHEKKITKEQRNSNSNSDISMIKKIANHKKSEKTSLLVSINNPVLEENISITYSPKVRKFKMDVSPDSNGSSKSSKHPVPLFIGRFRCIEPYPPNDDKELELKIGDVVYVHKKGEDGWYKGTLQRTGKMGLFPASFLEPC